MGRRRPPRKVTYFEPVRPRLARNTIIESTFGVGRRFSCTMRGRLRPARPRRGNPAGARSMAPAHARASRRGGACRLARRPQCHLSARRVDHRRAPRGRRRINRRKQPAKLRPVGLGPARHFRNALAAPAARCRRTCARESFPTSPQMGRIDRDPRSRGAQHGGRSVSQAPEKESPKEIAGMADCDGCLLWPEPEPSDKGRYWHRAIRECRGGRVTRLEGGSWRHPLRSRHCPRDA
jgi:hypothetical protein